MNFKILLTFLMTISFCSCNGQNTNANNITTATPMPINRFDKALFQLINSEDTTLNQQLLNQYPLMTEILGKGILNMQSPEIPGFFNKLENFYSEPTLKNLYADAIKKYDSVTETELSIGNAFAWIHEKFPTMQIPALYMHVSGFNQNVLVGDSLLSLSIDKYMGEDYPLYQDFFYDYQRRKMQPSHVVPDYIAGWLMSEYPFNGNENVLLDRMIYEGKIKYLVLSALPEMSPAALFGYTDEAWEWCKNNEANIWKAIVERKHLYTPDQMNTMKYFEDMPAQFLASDAPGNIGSWVGLQIIEQYIKETNTTPEALMKNDNAQEILAASKYKGG